MTPAGDLVLIENSSANVVLDPVWEDEDEKYSLHVARGKIQLRTEDGTIFLRMERMVCGLHVRLL